MNKKKLSENQKYTKRAIVNGIRTVSHFIYHYGEQLSIAIHCSGLCIKIKNAE